MTRRLIVVAATGEMSGICAITLPRIKAYAERVGAALYVLEGLPERYQHPKYRMFEAGELYVKRILILDADILIRDGAPDIFAELPEGNHILDEAAIRAPGAFDLHKYEVCAFAKDWADFGAHWWSPGVVLMDQDAIRKVYQMPPWDVTKNLFTVSGGARIVKNMPWINYQIAKQGIEITPLDIKWNCFVNGRGIVRDAYFWHCAGNESQYNVQGKVSIAVTALRKYGELKVFSPRVHCVMGRDQHRWILGELWRAIEAAKPEGAIVSVSDKPVDEPGVINYYNPYRGYKSKSKRAKDVLFCTHPEIEPLFWDAPQQADHTIVMCDQYRDSLIARGVHASKVTRIHPGADPMFRDMRLRVFNPAIMQGRERKGKELWKRLAKTPWIEAICSNGRLTKEQLLTEYLACDVVVSTARADGEGGPMSVPEAAQLGKPMVMPIGVGLVGDVDIPLITRYTPGDYDNLINALRTHYERKQNQPRYLTDWTWERWGKEHWDVFVTLDGGCIPEPQEIDAVQSARCGDGCRSKGWKVRKLANI